MICNRKTSRDSKDLIVLSSPKQGLAFKQMIVDVIKEDLPYIDRLKRELKYTKHSLDTTRKVSLQGRIKMIEEDLDRLELPTGTTKEIFLKKYRPFFLPDHSISWSSKKRTVSFTEKIVFQKGFNGGEYGGLASIDEDKQRYRDPEPS